MLLDFGASSIPTSLGRMGSASAHFVSDVVPADAKSLESAFLGGVMFNASNILLVAAIDVAPVAVSFPIGFGLALVIADQNSLQIGR